MIIIYFLNKRSCQTTHFTVYKNDYTIFESLADSVY